MGDGEVPVLTEVTPPVSPPQSSPTSLSRDASRCSGLSDMRNCRVVSAMGWGPGRSGAYWTLRITRRTEFLGGEENPAFLARFGSNLSFLLVCYIKRRMAWEVPAGCPARLGCKGAAPWPCQAAYTAPCHGRAGLLACNTAVDISIPTLRSSLTHLYSGKHHHPSSILGNISILEIISIPAPAWRTSPSQPIQRTSLSQAQPGGYRHLRPSLEDISVPAPTW